MELAPDYARFRERFREALDPRLYPIEYLDALIESGAATLLSTQDAAIIFEIRTYPSGARDLHGLVAAGDLHSIADALIPKAEAWARERGCLGAVIESRAGWARVLRAREYHPHQIALRKEL